MSDLFAEFSDLVMIQRPTKISDTLPPDDYSPDWRALLLKTFEVRSMVRVLRAEPGRWYFSRIGHYFDVKAVNDRGVWVHPCFTETPLRPIRFEDIDL